MKKKTIRIHKRVSQKDKLLIPLLFFVFLLVGIYFVVALGSSVSASISNTQGIHKELRTFAFHSFRQACGAGALHSAHCFAKITTQNDGVTPLTSAQPASTVMNPVQLHTAYNLPCTPGGPVASVCNTPSSFGPQTIAIVDTDNSVTIANDLHVFSANYGLPDCTVANGCLSIVNQNGGSTPPTGRDAGWELETSLDVEMAHAICQTCKILLVEANTSNFSDLGTGINTAAQLGATSISNSYGGSEFAGENNYDFYTNHPGVAVVASAGDSGYGAEYPAASPYVVSVGGTTLNIFTDNTYASESVWSGSGSGCSASETANAWQMGVADWLQTGCGNKRGISDIAMDADPNTGVAMYDSTPYQGQSGWFQVGGTSVGSPVISAIFALATAMPGNVQASSILYNNYNTSVFHNILSGSNGSCGTIMCSGGTGYNGPTGLGTPNGVTGFDYNPNTTPQPTPTAGPTPTTAPTPTTGPTPTAAPTPTPTPGGPVVQIVLPFNGSYVKHNSTTYILAYASDAGAKITKTVVSVNSASVTLTSGFVLVIWHVGPQTGVRYTITATSYDSLGRSGSSTVYVTSR